jgi:hypothetical protein
VIVTTDSVSACFMNCRAYLFLAMCVAATVAENVNCWGSGANCQCGIAGSTCQQRVTCVSLAYDLPPCIFFLLLHAFTLIIFPLHLSRGQQAL